MGKQQRFMDGERLKLVEYGLRSAAKDTHSTIFQKYANRY